MTIFTLKKYRTRSSFSISKLETKLAKTCENCKHILQLIYF